MTRAIRRSSVTGRILLVEDDRALRGMLAEYLTALGHEIDEVAALDQAIARVRARPYDLVLSDLLLERGTGLDLLRSIKEADIACEVIIMTGYGGVETAVEAIRNGAYNFITKPIEFTRLEFDVLKALEKKRLEDDLRRLRAPHEDAFGRMIGISDGMRGVFALLRQASRSDANVLLVGASGTGKDLAARAIHDASSRAEGPYVALACASIPEELLESELFGHARGAFTGAESAREGVFLRARGGTVFLDGIADAPERAQRGLLRVLQERVVRPLGTSEERPVDVRIVAASGIGLDDRVAEGTFREDLYYRLATIVIRLPPLAERPEDVPPLAASVLGRLGEHYGRAMTLAPRALEKLTRHSWPGNVRELEHVLERAVFATTGLVIQARDIPLDEPDDGRVPTLEELEREHIRAVISRCHGNKLRAARLLGVPRATLYRKLVRYGLAPPCGIDAEGHREGEGEGETSNVEARGEDTPPGRPSGTELPGHV